MPRAPSRPRRAPPGGRGAGRRDGPPPRRDPAPDGIARGRRGADPRICPVEPGGRRPDVSCRGAPAHSRRGDARCPDPRQDRGWGLASPSRTLRLALRQRGDLGPARDGQAHCDHERGGAECRPDAPDRAGRRAADPKGRRSRHAADGRALRRRPDHRGGLAPGARPRGQGLHPFLRHARRGRDHRRRRGPLRGRLPGGDRRHRSGFGGAGHPCGTGHLDQALGPAPALQPGQTGACPSRTGATGDGPGAASP